MAIDKITVRGARQHNLKDVSVELPRNRLTVVTGLSGSGKSSLAFDTIYAEGQRRYVESLSAYARQFLDQLEKPDVDAIEGLSPAISIEQKTTMRSTRSTVGTVTEVYDYLRLLFSSIGIPHCPKCGRPISRQSIDQIVQQMATLPEGERVLSRRNSKNWRGPGSIARASTARFDSSTKTSNSTNGEITRSKLWSIACSSNRACRRGSMIRCTSRRSSQRGW